MLAEVCRCEMKDEVGHSEVDIHTIQIHVLETDLKSNCLLNFKENICGV